MSTHAETMMTDLHFSHPGSEEEVLGGEKKLNAVPLTPRPSPRLGEGDNKNHQRPPLVVWSKAVALREKLKKYKNLAGDLKRTTAELHRAIGDGDIHSSVEVIQETAGLAKQVSEELQNIANSLYGAMDLDEDGEVTPDEALEFWSRCCSCEMLFCPKKEHRSPCFWCCRSVLK